MKSQHNTQDLDDACDFPVDVLENILSRLHVKSLLRFKTVCKSWKAVIEDPAFAGIHSKQSNISNSQYFYADYSSPGYKYCLIKFKGKAFYLGPIMRFQLEEHVFAHLLCCCEGILVLQNYFKETTSASEKKLFVLLNPFTRKHSTFSSSFFDEIRAKHASSWVGYGLCFDKYQDDYKFIVVLRGGRYLLYSVKNDIWVEKRSELRGYVADPGAYVNGVVYFFMSKDLSPVSHGGIVYFDPKDDLLKKLHAPEDLMQERFRLINLRGNLCLYARDRGSLIRIWLLKEDEDEDEHGGGVKRRRWMKIATVYNEIPEEDDDEYDKFFFAHIPLRCT